LEPDARAKSGGPEGSSAETRESGAFTATEAG